MASSPSPGGKCPPESRGLQFKGTNQVTCALYHWVGDPEEMGSYGGRGLHGRREENGDEAREIVKHVSFMLRNVSLHISSVLLEEK